MALKGNFATLPITDLLQLISGTGKSGALTVGNNKVMKKIFIEEGVIVAAESSEPTEYLGQYLLSRGLISEEELRLGLDKQETSGGILGKILVDIGALSAEKLQRALVEKAQEIVYSLFSWEEAEFVFNVGERPETPIIPISLDVQEALWKGSKRHEELRKIRQVFPDSRVVLRHTNRRPPGSSFKGPLAAKAYEMVDGRRTIAEIQLRVHSSEYAICRFFYGLHSSGYLEVASTAAASRPADVPAMTGSVEVGQALLEEGCYEEALEIFRRASKEEPDRRIYRSLVELAERRLVENLYKQKLPPGAVPRVVCERERLMQEDLSPEEYFLLSRINGQLDIRAIVKVSPLREVDAVQLLLRLLEQGLIAVDSENGDLAQEADDEN